MIVAFGMPVAKYRPRRLSRVGCKIKNQEAQRITTMYYGTDAGQMELRATIMQKTWGHRATMISAYQSLYLDDSASLYTPSCIVVNSMFGSLAMRPSACTCFVVPASVQPVMLKHI